MDCIVLSIRMAPPPLGSAVTVTSIASRMELTAGLAEARVLSKKEPTGNGGAAAAPPSTADADAAAAGVGRRDVRLDAAEGGLRLGLGRVDEGACHVQHEVRVAGKPVQILDEAAA